MGEMGQFLPMILIFAVAYFFIIRPQMKRQKDERKFVEALKKGDKVITKSGLHGKVVDLNDKDSSFILETMAGRLKFDRSAISMEMSKKLNAPAK
ncbi:protein translocase subunit yajC [Robiginitalea myxolifaciens]|uniref:Sec translocon accessory complex subunit YajC n=1 Tax=Robiginitalea myxolifaciens TaxID=400055 RepID=A0A1I6H8Q4_9FLAO|nr:preprotein translocase subunit YajC [Robiginitalea myxolifaciens]SFR50865.1 protein translocase subunit yajC [Robiginitalea myxolifaciens]